MRSASRLADVSINTVSKLLEDYGRFGAGFHDWADIIVLMDADVAEALRARRDGYARSTLIKLRHCRFEGWLAPIMKLR